MLLDKNIAVAISLAAAALASTPSLAEVSKTIYLRADVPVICNVQFQPAGQPGSGGIVALGTTEEFCNAPRGYRVILQHPAHMTGAFVLSGVRRIPLSESGETVVADSDLPAIETRRLALDLGERGNGRLQRLGLRIEVKY